MRVSISDYLQKISSAKDQSLANLMKKLILILIYLVIKEAEHLFLSLSVLSLLYCLAHFFLPDFQFFIHCGY